MSRVLTMPQRSEEWFKARRGIPTASRFARILTPARGEPATAQGELIDELLAECLCPGEEAVVQHASADMEYGMRLEAEARCSYELEFAKGAEVKEVGFVLSDCGRFGGSPDALVGEDGGVELKVPTPAVHIGYLRAGVLPLKYKAQVHGYLVITGRAFWDFMSHARGLPPFLLRVKPDDFTKKLAAELNHFCTRYNEARVRFDLPPLGLLPAAA